MQDSNPRTMRSWPEPKLEAQPTEPPRLPDNYILNNYCCADKCFHNTGRVQGILNLLTILSPMLCLSLVLLSLFTFFFFFDSSSPLHTISDSYWGMELDWKDVLSLSTRLRTFEDGPPFLFSSPHFLRCGALISGK